MSVPLAPITATLMPTAPTQMDLSLVFANPVSKALEQPALVSNAPAKSLFFRMHYIISNLKSIWYIFRCRRMYRCCP